MVVKINAVSIVPSSYPMHVVSRLACAAIALSTFSHSCNPSLLPLLILFSLQSAHLDGVCFFTHYASFFASQHNSYTSLASNMAPSSVASDDSGNDVTCSFHRLCLNSTDTLQKDGFIVDIDAIQAHGIGAVDIAKLKANGYYTIASVHAATRRNLLKIKGFSEIKVDKVKDAIAKCQV
jgi:hypothetical protein